MKNQQTNPKKNEVNVKNQFNTPGKTTTGNKNPEKEFDTTDPTADQTKKQDTTTTKNDPRTETRKTPTDQYTETTDEEDTYEPDEKPVGNKSMDPNTTRP